MDKFFMERRAHKRLQHETDAKYKIISDETDLMGLRYREAKTANISRGGICMKLAMRLSEGSVIRLEIPLEKRKKNIDTFCEVEWCSPDAGEFMSGLSFINLTDDDLDYINELEQNLN